MPFRSTGIPAERPIATRSRLRDVNRGKSVRPGPPMAMTRALLLLTTLLASGVHGARPASVPVACDGRYAAEGEPLMAPTYSVPAGEIIVAGGRVLVGGWCPLTRAAVRPTRGGGVDLRVRFRRCGLLGRAGLRARIDTACRRMTGAMKVGRRSLRFAAVRTQPPEIGPGTFKALQQRVFTDRGCTLVACHGPQAAGGLDLGADGYDRLVGVQPTNAAARAAGWLRVVPGDAGRSFLSRKLHGDLEQSHGERMPLGASALPADELAFVDAWINAGAPPSGDAPGAGALRPLTYEPARPLPVPPDGVQLVLDGPVLQPGEEQEGCLWVPAPSDRDLVVGVTEVSANPGTHHLAIWRHRGDGVPPLGRWLKGDVACLGSGADFNAVVGGTGSAPYSVGRVQHGIVSVLPGGGYYGLNAHYYNEFDVPIQVKVWANFHPYQGTPAHYAKGITALDARARIRVAPFTQQTVRGRFTNDTGRTLHVLAVGGHMHKRGLRYRAWRSDGTLVIEDFDWAHPTFKGFWPPYDLAPGDWLDFECLHDNGVTREVRRDAAGSPVTVRFGISAEDEMCILTGSYYDD